MQHWIVDKEAVALSSWQEAIPRAVILRRDQVLSGFSETPGVLLVPPQDWRGSG